MKRIKSKAPRGAFLLRMRDLIRDVSIELSSRFSRTVLMVSAVAFSTGALLASVGISQNAAHQIDADIAASATRQVLVTAQGKSDEDEGASETGEELGEEDVRTIFPANTVERLGEIATVESSGFRLDLDLLGLSEVDRPAIDAAMVNVGLKGATSGYLDAAQIRHTGDMQWMLDGEQNVAYLGELAAEKLGIPVTDDTRNLSIVVNGVSYSIIGFLPGEHSFTDAVVIPYTNSVAIANGDSESQVLIRTKLGAGSQVSGVARLAILPSQPEKLAVSQVISPNAIRENVSDQLTTQATWVGAFLIVLTVLLITNSMIVSVKARTTEIGVRRALGS
ncbi:MAG: ABC transporter permease, partial [Ancrocorticia sp.]|uniref:ABC transporter permease n=1 Tax=Ancrocorticia sp. TaxID=2593684 RepID=UPI003F93F1B7